MGWKAQLRQAVFCAGLALASMMGASMRPDEIEELMASMNRPRLERTIPEASDSGEDLIRKLLG